MKESMVPEKGRVKRHRVLVLVVVVIVVIVYCNLILIPSSNAVCFPLRIFVQISFP